MILFAEYFPGMEAIWHLYEGEDMRVLKFVWKCLCGLWLSEGNSTGIDSHKWESKIETYRRLSSRQY